MTNLYLQGSYFTGLERKALSLLYFMILSPKVKDNVKLYPRQKSYFGRVGRKWNSPDLAVLIL
jgi:hypothetical protein